MADNQISKSYEQVYDQLYATLNYDPQGNQQLFQLVNDYLGFIFLGTPLMLLSLGFSYFIRAEGKPNLATMVL